MGARASTERTAYERRKSCINQPCLAHGTNGRIKGVRDINFTLDNTQPLEGLFVLHRLCESAVQRHLRGHAHNAIHNRGSCPAQYTAAHVDVRHLMHGPPKNFHRGLSGFRNIIDGTWFDPRKGTQMLRALALVPDSVSTTTRNVPPDERSKARAAIITSSAVRC